MFSHAPFLCEDDKCRSLYYLLSDGVVCAVLLSEVIYSGIVLVGIKGYIKYGITLYLGVGVGVSKGYEKSSYIAKGSSSICPIASK
jgi:hypothetical protein